jgi:hypothetical protein
MTNPEAIYGFVTLRLRMEEQAVNTLGEALIETSSYFSTDIWGV